MCSQHDQHLINRCGKFVRVESKAEDGLGLCSLAPPSFSQLSCFGAMSGRFNTAVYYKKGLQRNTPDISTSKILAKVEHTGGFDSAICCKSLSGDAMEQKLLELEVKIDTTRSSNRSVVEFNADPLFSMSESSNGCHDGDYCFSEPSKSDTQCLLNQCLHEYCSSSKSNLDPHSASLKNDIDDAGESSSSVALVTEVLHDNMPERDICISVLKNHGLLASVGITHVFTSTSNCCLIPCKVCGCSDTTLKMLICDHCNDTFHLSCCNPRVKKVPYDEWLCLPCLRKKRKLLTENSSSKSLNASNKAGGCNNILSKGEARHINSMLRETEPYRSSARIGIQFQAEVPDWNGPVNDEASPTTELVEMDPSTSSHDISVNKSFRVGSIGNWLQCQEVILGIGKGIDGTVCGKWRRAPLFEVQTDDWECFQSVLWDPAHADCAVPQELETEEVMKQLKYIEMLRPRLDAKRRKLDCNKRSDLQNGTET